MSDLVLYTSAEVAEILKMNPQVVQRKLQAGEIPGYRIGREWRVEDGQLREWLETHSNRRPGRDDPSHWFEGDSLRAIPHDRDTRRAVFDQVVERLEPDRTYTEVEVSALLRPVHHDVATLRREMVGERHLVRTPDGIYKRASTRGEGLHRS